MHYVAEDRFVNLMRIEAGAADGFSDDFAAKLGSGESRKASLEFADGRSHSGENNGGFRGHDEPPEE